MNISKLSIMMFITFIMLFTLNVNAQDSKSKSTPEEKAKKYTDKIQPVLSLSEEQYTKMYDLNLQQINWKKESKASNLSKTAKKIKREEFKASEYSILSAEQMVKYKEYLKNHHKSWFHKIFGIF